MKRFYCLTLAVFLFGWYYIKSDIKRLLKRLLNRRMLIIFCIVFILLSSEVWVPYLIGFITGNQWWIGIGSACWAFWLGPFTPFLELCIVITFGVDSLWRRLHAKIRSR